MIMARIGLVSISSIYKCLYRSNKNIAPCFFSYFLFCSGACFFAQANPIFAC
jgi:hypothetical protein